MAQTLANVELLQAELERKFPELALHRLRESGMSGKALSIVYQDVADKVVEARGNYDSALVRAQQMALSIGGMRGYFEGFGLKSYEAGDEEHRIGDRPVLTELVDYQLIELGLKLGIPVQRLWPKLELGFSNEELEEMEAEAGAAQASSTPPAVEGTGQQQGAVGVQITEADLAQAKADLEALKGLRNA